MESAIALALCLVAFVMFVFLARSVKILPEHQRALVFRLGRPVGVRGPGLYLSIPIIDHAITVDLRPQDKTLQGFKFTSRDQVSMEADWSWNYNIIDVEKAILNTPNFEKSVEEAARNVFQEMYAGDLLVNRGDAEARLADRLRNVAAHCGLRVNEARVKDVRKTEG